MTATLTLPFVFRAHLENDALALISKTEKEHFSMVDTHNKPPGCNNTFTNASCLRCMPAHSQLRLRLKYFVFTLTPDCQPHLSACKNTENPPNRGGGEEMSHLYVCVCYPLSWLCVKRRAETSVSPALLATPPLLLYSASFSTSPPPSASLNLLSHPPHSFFFNQSPFFSPSASFSILLSSINLLMSFEDLLGDPQRRPNTQTYTHTTTQ